MFRNFKKNKKKIYFLNPINILKKFIGFNLIYIYLKTNLNYIVFNYKKYIFSINKNIFKIKADYQNLKKRTEYDIDNAYKFSIENFSENLLLILDSLESSVENKNINILKILEGLKLTLSLFNKVFLKNNITEIIPKTDDKFNPDYHLAISTVTINNKKNNSIVNTLQKGYKIFNRILRPALVVVNKV